MDTNQVLLGLLRRSLFDAEFTFDCNTVLWEELFSESKAQAVHLLIYDCLTPNERSTMPKELQERWRLSALHTLSTNEQLAWEQNRILTLIKDEDISCVVLKGCSCAFNYPKPELRSSGDIDLLLYEKDLIKAKKLLEQAGYTPAEEDHHCHISMHRGYFTVELHFEPNGLPDGKKGDLFRQFFSNAIPNMELRQNIPVLNPYYEAIVLLIHKIRHITTSGLGLRQLCDWAEFVHKKIDTSLWETLEPLLQNLGLLHFTKIVTLLCVEHLGLPSESAIWCATADSTTAASLLEDFLLAGNFGHKENRYGQRLFTDGGKGGRLASFIRTGFRVCRENWPICKKYPILIFFAPFVLLTRYHKQRKTGARPKLHLKSIFRTAAQKQNLYRELHPFENKEESF